MRNGEITVLHALLSLHLLLTKSPWLALNLCKAFGDDAFFLLPVEHDWEKLVGGVQDHIGSLNWGYRVQLRDKNVKYINAFGEFLDPHTIKASSVHIRHSIP